MILDGAVGARDGTHQKREIFRDAEPTVQSHPDDRLVTEGEPVEHRVQGGEFMI